MAMLYLRNKPIGAVSGGSSGGGHVIENASGTDLAQRDTLKFSGYLQATDDSTNETSVVSDAPSEVEYSVWQTMTDTQKTGKKWIIKNVPKTGGTPTDNSVSVVADGVKTYATLLNELQALVDYSKITRNTALVTIVSGETTIYKLSQNVESTGRLSFDRTRVFVPSTYKITTYTYVLEPNNSHIYYAHYTTNYDFGDADASVPVSGTTFTLYYNLIASAGIGDIDAEDVTYGSGTVADALDDMFTEITLSVNETIQPTEPANKNLGACPSGYAPLSVYWVRQGGGNVFSVSCYLYGSAVMVTIANEYPGQAVTFVGTLHVVLRKTS